MDLSSSSEELDKIFEDLNISIQNNTSDAEQRVSLFYETCFSREMLNESPIKIVAGSISSFAFYLTIFLKDNNISYQEFIKSFNLSEDRTNMLLEFEYDLITIRPVGGPGKLSEKPINKSLIAMYSKVVLAIFTSIGSIGTFIQPLIDIQSNIQEKELKEIDKQIEFEKIIQKERELDQKDRELDQKDRELDQIEKNKEHKQLYKNIDSI
ncbi:hypothetical protein [Vagococcus carniphilus]|uniref:hypothetical protein n=1 Tax=Vagococcus carniphilus TaxID=218144 RepID=UPI0028919B76|nr:hypothetical protein [Vagococcus carniphilus]MDT2864339.1 hypothetical protein [Vagococcus carniphilus]